MPTEFRIVDSGSLDADGLRSLRADLWPLVTSRAVYRELGYPVLDAPGNRWVVAYAGSEVAGWATIDLTRFEKSGLVALDWAYVAPAYRCQGLYARLFAHRLEIADEIGPKIIRGTTKHDHVRRVFERHGFLPTSTRGSWTYYERHHAVK